MTQARNEQIDEETTPYYHCVSRCVRRAFLCGDDPYSGKNFDHRRQWVVDRLMLLGAIFSIDVLAYAVMANHLHLVVALRSERAALWSAEEIVARFGRLFPMAKAAYERMDEAQQAMKVEQWRERLSSLSWMMGALNVWMARKANKEDGCTGHFWEGRFRSEPLLDESGLLACMAYVDLNPVRAGECDRLEDAEWTSIGERLRMAATATENGTNETEVSNVPVGLLPFADQVLVVEMPGDDHSETGAGIHTASIRTAVDFVISTHVDSNPICRLHRTAGVDWALPAGAWAFRHTQRSTACDPGAAKDSTQRVAWRDDKKWAPNPRRGGPCRIVVRVC